MIETLRLKNVVIFMKTILMVCCQEKLPLRSNAYDDVTDFEICGEIQKRQRPRYLENKTFFSSDKKIH